MQKTLYSQSAGHKANTLYSVIMINCYNIIIAITI